jgi:hypothetical protein
VPHRLSPDLQVAGGEVTVTSEAVVDCELATPDTWEGALSGGGVRRELWERLLRERKLGALALLRNLHDSKVDETLVLAALKGHEDCSRVAVPLCSCGAFMHGSGKHRWRRSCFRASAISPS